MKFTATVFALMAAAATANPFAATSKRNAKSAYVNNLMRGARATENSQLRKLDEEEYIPDISGYSVRFEKCQFVKAYDDEIAEDEEAGTVLATKRFVIFRLCPENSCSSCNYGYGEYIVDLETYLQAAVEYQQQLQEEMCQACDECGNEQEQEQEQQEGEDGEQRRRAVDCDTCYQECQNIENMEDNGYIDATEFLECQMVYDPEDDRSDAYYAGPICSNGGSKIKIGVFSDENCFFIEENKEVEDYLVDGDGRSMSLSHALLKETYNQESCVSCLVVEEDDGNNDNNNNNDDAEPEVTDMCQQLYEGAAKCEKNHGFDNGFADYAAYENQAANEGVVCEFISSLYSGTYDETGEIVVKGKSGSSSDAPTTGGQKFALAFFILGTIGLAVYAAMLHSKLTKGGKADLSRQGGAMA